MKLKTLNDAILENLDTQIKICIKLLKHQLAYLKEKDKSSDDILMINKIKKKIEEAEEMLK